MLEELGVERGNKAVLQEIHAAAEQLASAPDSSSSSSGGTVGASGKDAGSSYGSSSSGGASGAGQMGGRQGRRVVIRKPSAAQVEQGTGAEPAGRVRGGEK